MSTPKDLIESSKSLGSQQQAASSEFPYAALGHGTHLHPAVDLRLIARSGTAFPVRALVDSGADCSCFPEGFAASLGIDLEECEQNEVQTGNGLAIHYCAAESIRAEIVDREIQLVASFGPIGVPVLGRDDFFKQFLVEINHPRRTVVLTPHEQLG